MRNICSLTFLCGALSLQASTIDFTGTSASGCGGNSCSASAAFTVLDSHDFQITLDNTLSSIADASQLLTDLSFSMDASNVTMTGSSGTFVNIDGSGVPTVGSTGTTGWGFGSNGASNGWLLCIICGDGVTAGGAQPAQGIIDSQASYSSANGSIKGNPAHNPFLQSGATFTFSTDATLPTTGGSNPFSNVAFSFGTTFGNDVPGTSIPEPLSMFLTGVGLIATAAFFRRRHQS